MKFIRNHLLASSRLLMISLVFAAIVVPLVIVSGSNDDLAKQSVKVCGAENAYLLLSDSPFYDIVRYSPVLEGRQDIVAYECSEKKIIKAKESRENNGVYLYILILGVITAGPAIVVAIFVFWLIQERRNKKNTI